MVINVNFNNYLLVEETGVPGKNLRPAATEQSCSADGKTQYYKHEDMELDKMNKTNLYSTANRGRIWVSRKRKKFLNTHNVSNYYVSWYKGK
jgi:hypothetical protein